MTEQTQRKSGPAHRSVEIGVAVAVVRSTLNRVSVLSTANPIWSAAALLTEKWTAPATSEIAIMSFVDSRIASLPQV